MKPYRSIRSSTGSRLARAFFPALALWLAVTGVAEATQKSRIEVAVSTAVSPPSVRFDWDTQEVGVTFEIHRRPMGAVGFTEWTLLDTVSHPATTYTDDTIVAGEEYEYWIERPRVDSSIEQASTFVTAGLDVPLVESRGRMILMVDETRALALDRELARLELDLAADGWDVVRVDAPRDGDAHHSLIRETIVDIHAEDPDGTTGLYLFGRLPIVYTADTWPDGHGLVPHPADAYYADIDDTWPDSAPEDDQLDTEYVPDAVELQNGRVDLAGMKEWTKGETELLRDYLNKTHRFKRGGLEVARRGTPGGHGNQHGEHNIMFSMFGPDDFVEADISGFGLTTDGESTDDTFLWVVDGGNWRGADYADQEHKLAFSLNFASHKQKWHQSNNQMRALLAQPTWGFTSAWGGRPYVFPHSGNMGYPAGYAMMRSQNSRNYEYQPAGYYTYMAGAAWVNLMGDPSLRLHPVAPPTGVAAVRSGDSVTLSWTPSADPDVLGYHVYRSSDRLSGYVRLNGTALTGTELVDSGAPAEGDLWYQVRAVKRETVVSGSYLNQSLGEFALLSESAMDSNQRPTAVSRTVSTAPDAPVPVPLGGNDPEGDELGYLVTEHPTHGMLRGSPPSLFYVPDPGFSGTDAFSYSTFDGVGNSPPATIEINVEGEALLVWEFGDPGSSLQDKASTANHADVLPATLAVEGMNEGTHFNDDGIGLTNGAKSTTLDTGSHVSWVVEPSAGKAVALDGVVFSTYRRNEDFYQTRLRVSTDGFTTWRTLPLVRNEPRLEGSGDNHNDGIYHFADLSEVAELREATGPVEFRVYLWDISGGRFGIGKAGKLRPDIAVTGTVSDAPAPATGLGIVTAALSPIYLGEGISQQLVAEGGTGQLTWSVVGGALPSGVTLSSAGLLSGVPPAAASGSFTVRVIDAGSGSDERIFGYDVESQPPVDSGPVLSDEIRVRGNGTPVLSGDDTPSASDHTLYPDTALGASSDRVFTIEHRQGESSLSGVGVEIGGAGAAAFELVSAPAASLEPGASTSFEIRFTPDGVGFQSATVTVAASPAAGTPYTFRIGGRSPSYVPMPGATVEQGFYNGLLWGDPAGVDQLELLSTGRNDEDFTQFFTRQSDTVWTDPGNRGLPDLSQVEMRYADFNNDGALDLVILGSDDVSGVYRNTEGAFSRTWTGPAGIQTAVSLTTGDIDNDGRTDFAVLYADTSWNTIFSLYRNEGDGSFEEVTLTPAITTSDWGPISLTDVNGDGWTDLVVAPADDGNGTDGYAAAIYRNDGDGFTRWEGHGISARTSGSMAWDDFDGDGDRDAVITGRLYEPRVGTRYPVVVYRNDPDGFVPLELDSRMEGRGNGPVRWVDLDADGRLDILLSGAVRIDGSFVYSAVIFHQSSPGVFELSPERLPGGSYSSAAAAADVTGDGAPDLAVGGFLQSGHATGIHLSQEDGGGPPSAPGAPVVATDAATGITTVRWNAASDDLTPDAALGYRLRVGTVSGGQDIVAAHANPATGFRRIASRDDLVLGTESLLAGLPDGTYHVAVQAVDGAFLGGAWSPETTFELPPPTPRETFDDWAADNGLTGDEALPGGSPAGDGVANLIKFALGLDPDVPATVGADHGLPEFGSVVIPDETEGPREYLTLSFTPDPDAPVDFVLEAGGNLAAWPDRGVMVEAGPPMVYRDVIPMSESGSRFIRLRVIFVGEN